MHHVILSAAEREALLQLHQGGKSLDELAPLVWPHCLAHAVWVNSGSPQHEGAAARVEVQQVVTSLQRSGLVEFDGQHWKVTAPGRKRAETFDLTP
jgi:hypothetical protein